MHDQIPPLWFLLAFFGFFASIVVGGALILHLLALILHRMVKWIAELGSRQSPEQENPVGSTTIFNAAIRADALRHIRTKARRH